MPAMASHARSATSAWLSSSVQGTCGTTTEGASDCSSGDRGSWRNPHTRWRPAVAWCLRKCASCARCAAISVSLSYRDCSWYARCDFGALSTFADFRSGPALNVSSADAADDAAAAGDGALTEGELRAHVDEMPRARAALLQRWLRGASDGYCAATLDGDAGDCTFGDKGSWVLGPCHTATWASAAAYCLLRCARCARCAYVSLSLAREVT